MVNDELVQLQNYYENFIFPLKHHAQSTDAEVQYVETCLAIGRPFEDTTNLVSLRSINITPTNCDILKQIEGRKRKGNNHTALVFGNNKQPLCRQSNHKERSGARKLPSRVHTTSDKGKRLIECSPSISQ